MKKKCILLTIVFSLLCSAIVFAYDSNDPFSAEVYDVVLQENGNFAVKYGSEINMAVKVYEKENCIMIPLKMAINIENQKYTEKRQALYKKEETGAKLTLDEKEILFFEGKRDIIIDGQQKGLYKIPDIKEQDIYVSAEDLYILLNIYTPSQSHKFRWDTGSKQAGWFFKGDDGAHIRDIETENKKEYQFLVEQQVMLLQGKNEKNISLYEKNGHIMIAYKDVACFAEPKILLESVWQKQNNQLFVKTWDDIAQDVVFQKDNNIMLLNGVAVKMEEKAEIKNDRLYIPITAIFQMLNIPENDINKTAQSISVLY